MADEVDPLSRSVCLVFSVISCLIVSLSGLLGPVCFIRFCSVCFFDLPDFFPMCDFHLRLLVYAAPDWTPLCFPTFMYKQSPSPFVRLSSIMFLPQWFVHILYFCDLIDFCFCGVFCFLYHSLPVKFVNKLLFTGKTNNVLRLRRNKN